MHLLVTHLLDRPERDEILWSMPLHVSLVPWFRHDIRRQVWGSMIRVAHEATQAPLEPQERIIVWEGSKGKAARLVRESPALYSLHANLMSSLVQAGVEFCTEPQVPYRPYVADQGEQQLPELITDTINRLDLVTMTSDGTYELIDSAPIREQA